jgi:Cu2+-exporting ATPase
MDDFKISLSKELLSEAEKLQEQAKTAIYFANGKEAIAAIAIADKIKATSKEAIETLQNRRIEVYMLTGDNQQTAASVAKQVGLMHYKAEVMPSEKADFVKDL